MTDSPPTDSPPTDSPSDEHERPPGAGDTEVAAVGRLREAFEYGVRARGHLYSAHQLVGRSDLLLGEAVELFEAAGHGEVADRLRRELVGRNVVTGRWTFQLVDDFDDTWYGPLESFERTVREQVLAGRRHVQESEMKDDRRTEGAPDQQRRPGL